MNTRCPKCGDSYFTTVRDDGGGYGCFKCQDCGHEWTVSRKDGIDPQPDCGESGTEQQAFHHLVECTYLASMWCYQCKDYTEWEYTRWDAEELGTLGCCKCGENALISSVKHAALQADIKHLRFDPVELANRIQEVQGTVPFMEHICIGRNTAGDFVIAGADAEGKFTGWDALGPEDTFLARVNYNGSFHIVRDAVAPKQDAPKDGGGEGV